MSQTRPLLKLRYCICLVILLTSATGSQPSLLVGADGPVDSAADPLQSSTSGARSDRAAGDPAKDDSALELRCERPQPLEVLLNQRAETFQTCASGAQSQLRASEGSEQTGTAAGVSSARQEAPSLQQEQQEPAAEQLSEPPVEQEKPEEEDDSDRHNFASAKDGAKIVAANREAKKPAAVLDSDSDTYLRNECKADKWLAVELSQVAKIDAIELGQYELYSSRIKDFELSVTLNNVRTATKTNSDDTTSRILNSPHWQPVANFTAAKVKGAQTFKLRQPTWCKFMLLRWINQHGTEPVCALNDLRIFGKSAAEDLEDRLAGDLSSPDMPPSTTGTAWSQPPELGGYHSSQPPSPVQLVPPVTGSVLEPPANASSAPEPVRPSPPQEAPPGAQNKPEQSSRPEKSAEDTAAAAAAGGAATAAADQDSIPAVPASQRAVPVDPVPGAASAKPEESLPGNGAGSSKQRNGGSVYDMLVQEIKAAKLQQKTLTRQLQDLQQDLTSSSQQASLGVGSLREELAEIRQQVMTCAAAEPAAPHDNTTELMHAETTLQLGLLHQELRSLHAKLNSSQAVGSVQQTVLLLVLTIVAGMLLVSMQALPHLAWLSRLALMVLAAGNGLAGFWLLQAGQFSKSF